MLLGAHLSIAGGFEKACERAAALGCTALQIFTKNQVQWRASAINDEEARRFQRARREAGIHSAFAHDTYLHNLASTSDGLWRKSIDAFVAELGRCETLGLAFLVAHPGSPGVAGREAGIERMRRALEEILRRTRGFRSRIVLENTAGQGACLGARFEELARIVDGFDDIGFCLDTCHLFAAGYDLRTPAGWAAVIEEFDRYFGLSRLAAFHVNDSRKGLGSRVDRHAHIGQGELGLEAFRPVMTDPRLEDVPKVIETPKEGDMDRRNLDTLRRLASTAGQNPHPRARRRPAAAGKGRPWPR